MKYKIDKTLQADLDNRFTYHAPHGDQVQRYASLRGSARVMAEQICSQVPPGRERSLALTNLEQCMMFANAGIARGEVSDG